VKQCKNCGKTIVKLQNKFCNWKCYLQYKYEKLPLTYKEGEFGQCIICGKNLTRHLKKQMCTGHSNLQRKRPDLSIFNIKTKKGIKKGQNLKLRHGMYVFCNTCGKEIYKPFCRINEYNFCDRKCQMKFRKRKDIPKNILINKKISESVKKLHLEHPETHPNRRLASRRKMTKIEELLEKFLFISGIKDYICQYTVKTGKTVKFVDFCIPKLQMIIEADGEEWHKDKEKELSRDKAILSSMGEGWIIKHLTGKEIFELSNFLNLGEINIVKG
jgi:very-short-patch-repair endonuclease/RNA polymerase-binding transcription factor DksA